MRSMDNTYTWAAKAVQKLIRNAISLAASELEQQAKALRGRA
jgi:hypothetical protein